MRLKILVAMSLVLVLFLVGCSSEKKDDLKTVTYDSVDKTGANTDYNDISVISMKNFQFTPSVIYIKSGTKVRWINEDSIPHSIRSESFNSDEIITGKDFEFTFLVPGTYDYVCGLHPSMKGRIVVK